jgi:DNA oxidative demethylase
MQISFLTEPVLPLGNGAFLLTQFVDGDQFLRAATLVADAAPFRHLQTPGGKFTAAKMSNCGRFGWISDRQGYRYSPVDPLTGQPWPVMPELFLDCAKNAVQACVLAAPIDGFVPDLVPDFIPNACLVNRYEAKAAMGQHQDRDEADLTQPIVSVSMGDSAVFLLGGADRKAATQKILLNHGDVLVLSSAARRAYHGVRAPMIGKFGFRVNLTLRRAR